MKVQYKRNDIFIPEWNGNQTLPDNEQIKFHHRFLTVEERKKYIYLEPWTQGGATKVQSLIMDESLSEDQKWAQFADTNQRKFVQDARGIAKAITKSIDNLILVDEEGKENPIDTVEKLYGAVDAHAELVAEYEAHCLGITARADSKN